MNLLIIVLLIAAVASLAGGLLGSAVKFLLWIALGLAALAVIVWVIRVLTNRRSGIRR